MQWGEKRAYPPAPLTAARQTRFGTRPLRVDGTRHRKGLAVCRLASLPPCALAIAQYDRAIGDFDQAIRINPTLMTPGPPGPMANGAS
jgi:hypothetical protein